MDEGLSGAVMTGHEVKNDRLFQEQQESLRKRERKMPRPSTVDGVVEN